MKFTKIKAPVFIVYGQTLNEYEVRQLQVDVKNKIHPANIPVKDEIGNVYVIGEDGRFKKGTPPGLSLSYKITKMLLD
jgi:hypothetical protein